MLKKLIIFILALNNLNNLNNFASAFNLPDEFGAWHKDSGQIKNLDASYNNSKFGIWINKIYKANNNNKILEINLITGQGGLNLNLDIRPDIRPLMQAESGYKIIEIKNYKAILERNKFLPDILFIELNNKAVLSLELNLNLNLDEEPQELIDIAKEILEFIN